MVTADLRESGCERGGRAAILVQYESIFIEIELLIQTPTPPMCVSFSNALLFKARLNYFPIKGRLRDASWQAPRCVGK